MGVLDYTPKAEVLKSYRVLVVLKGFGGRAFLLLLPG